MRNHKLRNSKLRNSKLRNSKLRNSELQHAVDYNENYSSGIAELRLLAVDDRENSGRRIAELRTIADQRLRTTKFLEVADQRRAEALFINSGPAEAN